MDGAPTKTAYGQLSRKARTVRKGISRSSRLQSAPLPPPTKQVAIELFKKKLQLYARKYSDDQTLHRLAGGTPRSRKDCMHTPKSKDALAFSSPGMSPRGVTYSNVLGTQSRKPVEQNNPEPRSEGVIITGWGIHNNDPQGKVAPRKPLGSPRKTVKPIRQGINRNGNRSAVASPATPKVKEVPTKKIHSTGTGQFPGDRRLSPGPRSPSPRPYPVAQLNIMPPSKIPISPKSRPFFSMEARQERLSPTYSLTLPSVREGKKLIRGAGGDNGRPDPLNGISHNDLLRVLSTHEPGVEDSNDPDDSGSQLKPPDAYTPEFTSCPDVDADIDRALSVQEQAQAHPHTNNAWRPRPHSTADMMRLATHFTPRQFSSMDMMQKRHVMEELQNMRNRAPYVFVAYDRGGSGWAPSPPPAPRQGKWGKQRSTAVERMLGMGSSFNSIDRGVPGEYEGCDAIPQPGSIYQPSGIESDQGADVVRFDLKAEFTSKDFMSSLRDGRTPSRQQHQPALVSGARKRFSLERPPTGVVGNESGKEVSPTPIQIPLSDEMEMVFGALTKSVNGGGK